MPRRKIAAQATEHDNDTWDEPMEETEKDPQPTASLNIHCPICNVLYRVDSLQAHMLVCKEEFRQSVAETAKAAAAVTAGIAPPPMSPAATVPSTPTNPSIHGGPVYAQIAGPQAAGPNPPSWQQQQPPYVPNGAIPAPRPIDQSPFLNLGRLGGRTVTAMILDVQEQRLGRYGMGIDIIIDVQSEQLNPNMPPQPSLIGKWKVTIKVNSRNHTDLYARYGGNWRGQRIQIMPTYTASGSGSVRMAVVPL